MTQRILVVEDEKNIRDLLEESLEDVGFLVRSTGDGATALKTIKEGSIDLVILDLGLENVSGETVCLQAKKHSPDLPIIILTAKSASEDVVKGLSQLGADDYISKPFEMEELLARVKTRLKEKSVPVIKIDDLEVNRLSLEVKRGEKIIPLTAKEFKLLEYLLLNKGIVLSREAILDHIWMYSPDVETRVVDVYMGYLRKKIDQGFPHKLIHSVRGFGYTIK